VPSFADATVAREGRSLVQASEQTWTCFVRSLSSTCCSSS
jgi:hypothetical protein